MTRAVAAGPSGQLALPEACPCQGAHSEMDVSQLALSRGSHQQHSHTPIYAEADVAFCRCLCPQGHLCGLFLEHPSPPRGHPEQAPHLFAFSGLSDGWVARPFPGCTCLWHSDDGWGEGVPEAISEHTGVPRKELGQTSDCHSLR